MPRVFASIVALAAVLAKVSAAPTNYGSSYGESSQAAASSNYGGSSYGGSSYGGSSYGGSSYGSSSYGSSEYAQQDNSKSESSSSEEWKSTSTTQEEKYVATSTSSSSSWKSESTWAPSYGSGYKNWGGQGYNNCVQQCIAQYGAPAATYTAPASMETMAGSGTPTSGGSGSTHTVIVAPTQGVLRFVPFAVNASVGDTVRFVWGAGPHTVTKSSILNPCNASSDASFFTSGKQNKSFVFDQVVNDTNPTFFYCSVPTHCQKGMFGIINPPNALVSSATPTNVSAPTSSSGSSSMTVGQYVNSMVQTDSSMAALVAYVNNKTMGTSAYMWGMGMDMSSMPESQYGAIAQNTMYSALFYASNPGMVEAGKGASDVSGNGIMIPADISQTLATIGATSASTTSSSSSGQVAAPDNAAYGASSSSMPAASASATSKTNGSGKLASSTVLVGAVAILASFIAL